MKDWLTLIVRIVIALVVSAAIVVWFVRGVQVDASWAHPMLGRCLCFGIMSLCAFAGIMAVRHPWRTR